MKNGGGLRHFIIAFLVAVLFYVVAFHLIESVRDRKGPWTVIFSSEPGQSPVLIINQPALGISNVQVHFDFPATNSVHETIVFNEPRASEVPFALPFGECIFLDTTFLPGTVTMRCFGHEIELIPRVMVVDHRERAWSEQVIQVTGESQSRTNATEAVTPQ